MQGSSLEKMGSWILGSSQRERNNVSHKEKPVKTNINDVVMINGDEKNWWKWKIGIIDNIFMSKDNTIRSIRISTGSNQLLYPMELHCDSKSTTINNKYDKTLNVNAEKFWPKISAAAAAEQRIRNTADNENKWKTFDLHHQMRGEQCGNL